MNTNTDNTIIYTKFNDAVVIAQRATDDHNKDVVNFIKNNKIFNYGFGFYTCEDLSKFNTFGGELPNYVAITPYGARVFEIYKDMNILDLTIKVMHDMKSDHVVLMKLDKNVKLYPLINIDVYGYYDDDRITSYMSTQ